MNEVNQTGNTGQPSPWERQLLEKLSLAAMAGDPMATQENSTSTEPTLSSV